MYIELIYEPAPDGRSAGAYRLNGLPLAIGPSQEVIRHSLEFNHGYMGSGPAQLALAICLELFGRQAAVELYQDFKTDHIAGLGEDDGAAGFPRNGFAVILDLAAYAQRAEEIKNRQAGPEG